MADDPRDSKLLDRLPARGEPMRVPAREEPEQGFARVDVTWGKINPMRAAAGVETVGEIELAERVAEGASLIDTRSPRSYGRGTIPGAVNFPHDEIDQWIDELPEGRLVLFCNGPQCPATPDAVRRLIEAGRAPEDLCYYRGGMHDWVTLGLPVEVGDDS